MIGSEKLQVLQKGECGMYMAREGVVDVHIVHVIFLLPKTPKIVNVKRRGT